MPSIVSEHDHEYSAAVASGSGLGELFYRQVQKSPDAVAVDGDTVLSYARLHAAAAHLAQQLAPRLSHNQEPVGIVVQHGAADVVAQMAVTYAGGSCAPMDPSLADHQIQGRLRRLRAQAVLTDRANHGRELGVDAVCVDGPDVAEAPAADDRFPVATGLDHCTHLIHTPGTTHEPKAVRIAARSILHLVFHAPYEPVHASDVVAHANNSSFDVSLYDIWFPLLRGARVVALSKPVLLDLPVMASEIERLGITIMATTTALLNLAASKYPQAFSKLRIYFIGEAANVAAVKIILDQGPPGMLNAFGPTECCVFCLLHRVTPKDVEDGSVSIGKPIGHTVTYIVDDEGRIGDQGELWVGGPGVSPGYVDQPDENAAAFTTTRALFGAAGEE